MTPRLAIAALTATLALAAPMAPTAEAAAVQSYHYTTTGSISGMSDGPIVFQGESKHQPLPMPGTFDLGQFLTKPLPETATLSYDHTPFAIDLKVSPNHPGALPTPEPPYHYMISGQLNGSITGAGSSDMVATVTSIAGSSPLGVNATPPFPIEGLQINVPQAIVAPKGLDAGHSTLMAQVTVSGLPAPAPEPTSIAAFAVALGGWLMRRRLRPAA
jgi:hypothetical protein